jgi:hypothetical protein
MPKELIRLGMTFVQYMPVTIVDLFLVKLADFIFGDLSNYGIVRPGVGPLQLKSKTGRSSVIDVGTAGLIKKGVVKVKILFQQILVIISVLESNVCNNFLTKSKMWCLLLGVQEDIEDHWKQSSVRMREGLRIRCHRVCDRLQEQCESMAQGI